MITDKQGETNKKGRKQKRKSDTYIREKNIQAKERKGKKKTKKMKEGKNTNEMEK